jgi:hypothetical protein
MLTLVLIVSFFVLALAEGELRLYLLGSALTFSAMFGALYVVVHFVKWAWVN